MFSLSALTQNAPAARNPAQSGQNDDSGLIDLARLTSGFDASTSLSSPDPPLFVPQPLGVPALPVAQNTQIPRARSPWLVLSALAGLLVAAFGAVFWLSEEPAPMLPAPEMAPRVVAAVPNAALESPDSAPTAPSASVAKSAVPEAERPHTQAPEPPAAAVTPRPQAKRPRPALRPQGQRAGAGTKPPSAKPRRDPCAHCAAGDLRCHMQCSVR
jgi:hypothetical protein